MIRTLNPELDRIVLDALAERYKLLEKRDGIHLSTLIYCLTKAYFDQVSPLDPTDTELLNYATGYGLQEALFPAKETIIVHDNIIYRPDGIFQVSKNGVMNLVEVKSTRSGVKRYREGDLPETWIKYMKGGCYFTGKLEYHLSVIYLAERPSAKLFSETITFEPQELEENWEWLRSRKVILEKAFKEHTPPQPFTTAPAWMSENCRYKTICDAIIMMQGEKK